MSCIVLQEKDCTSKSKILFYTVEIDFICMFTVFPANCSKQDI